MDLHPYTDKYDTPEKISELLNSVENVREAQDQMTASMESMKQINEDLQKQLKEKASQAEPSVGLALEALLKKAQAKEDSANEEAERLEKLAQNMRREAEEAGEQVVAICYVIDLLDE